MLALSRWLASRSQRAKRALGEGWYPFDREFQTVSSLEGHPSVARGDAAIRCCMKSPDPLGCCRHSSCLRMVDAADYAAARREVKKLGLDPDAIPHDRP